MCTAREEKQVNKRSYLLYVLRPCLIKNGPKQSIPEQDDTTLLIPGTQNPLDLILFMCILFLGGWLPHDNE